MSQEKLAPGTLAPATSGRCVSPKSEGQRRVAFLWEWVLPLVTLSALTFLSLALRGALHAPNDLIDERDYNSFAQQVWHGLVPPPDWCPGFVLIYAFFANPWVSPTFAYHAIRLGLSVALVILTYAAVRRGVGPRLAFIASLPLALNFNLAVILTLRIAVAAIAALALVLIDRTPRRAALTLALMCLGILVRPEFFFVALVAFSLLWRVISKSAKWFAAPAVAALIVGVYFVVVPYHSSDRGYRMYFAFGQHYAWTATELGWWHGNYWKDYQQVLTRDFGDARTLPQIIRHNPAAVARHVKHNIILIPMNLAQTLALGSGRIACFIVPLLLLLITYRGIVQLWRRHSLLIMLRGNAPQLWIGVSMAGMYALWLLIRTRTDYQFALVPVIMVIMGLMLSALLPGLAEDKRARPVELSE